MGPLSAEGYEQIYVGVVNWLLMIVTIDLTIAFAKSRQSRTRRRCASGGRRSSTRRHNQSPHWCHALSDEDTAASCLRDRATRTRLQSHPRHEHHGHRAAYGRDQSIANTSPTPHPVCQSARRFHTTKTRNRPFNAYPATSGVGYSGDTRSCRIERPLEADHGLLDVRIADRQDLHQGDGANALLKINPVVRIVDSTPRQASG